MATENEKTIQIRTSEGLHGRWSEFQKKFKEDNGTNTTAEQIFEKVIDSYEQAEKEKGYTSFQKQIKDYDINQANNRRILMSCIETVENTENRVREEFKKELENQKNQITSLIEAKNKYKEEADKANEEAKQANEEKEKAIKENDVLVQRNNELQKDKEMNLETIQNLNEQNASMVSKVNEFDNLKNTCNALDTEKGKLVSDIRVLNSEKENLKKQLEDNKDEIKRLNTELDRIRNDNKSELDNLRKEYEAELDKQLDKQKSELMKAYEKQKNDLRESLNNTINDLKVRLENSEKRFDDLVSKLTLNQSNLSK